MIDWTQFKPTTEWAIRLLEAGGNDHMGCLYMETGLYKPWSMPTINALRRRGYKVETLCPNVFLLHPKQEQA